MTHVYSEDPEEEARLLAIRDAPCRIAAMAQCRLARWQTPLTPVEQLWLEERFLTGVARDQTIPQLSPQEWDALTRAILSLAPRRSLREPAPAPSRQHMSFASLKRLLPQQMDRLPSPAEFRGTVVEGRGRKKQTVEVRRRKRWVGFGWVDEGDADGTEPLLITEEGPT